MKKVAVVGSSGMAGHMIYKYLESLEKYQLIGIARTTVPTINSASFDVEEDMAGCTEYLIQQKPDVIINCMGVLIQASQKDPVRAIFINSCLPHLLEDTGKFIGAKIIHISTDCIFDGKSGPYMETDWPTESNWYGRSKALGEINNDKDLTIRTSIIGPELKADGTGLFKWFMGQTGEVSGYSNVLWNGITTLELATQIDKILDTNLTGVYHLTTDIPISKCDLLTTIKEVFKKTDVEVKPVPAPEERNKVLINSRKQEYDPSIPSYLVQLQELKNII